MHASRLKCKENGRTPLYYAIRYEAPEGVVELLLSCMTKEDILESDKEGKSALGLIWGDYVDGSFSGRKIYNKHKEVLKHWKMKGTPWEERVENARGLKKKLDGSKMGVCWKKADLLLRGAFKFPLKDDLKERRRKWRILHAAVSMRNHKSLAMMALVLHPEQVREIDNEDLFDLDGNDGDGDNDGDSTGDNDGDNHTNHFTALHLAAKSFMSGREIISHLLEMYPEAASIINPADNSYPLHYLCDNPSKTDWESDIAPIYNAYPEALLKQDVHGRTPFHRAFTVSGSKSSQTGGGNGNSSGNSSGVSVSSSNGSSIPPPAPLGTPTASRHSTDPDISVIQKILSIEPLVASISDNDGKLPFHSLAEHGEKWDLNIQSLYDTYPAVMSTRTNRQSGNNLPIHLVASNPDANASLVNKIIELNPRGASIENSHGRLPLHLVCESGKSFDGGFESIYNAYPRAIGIAERNDRGWLPLHFTVTCPNSTLEQIERVLDLNRDAASVVDGSNKTVLHLAIESGRSWDDGLKMLFDAYPDAIDIEDSSGRIPLVSALLTYQNGNHSLTKGGTTTTEEMHVKSFERNDSNDSHEMNENDNSLDELHVSQVNALYHLLKAAPSVLQRTSG